MLPTGLEPVTCGKNIEVNWLEHRSQCQKKSKQTHNCKFDIPWAHKTHALPTVDKIRSKGESMYSANCQVQKKTYLS